MSRAPLSCHPCVESLRRLTVPPISADRGQDFEKAGELRDKEMELKAKISAITGAAKEEEDAEQVGWCTGVRAVGPHDFP